MKMCSHDLSEEPLFEAVVATYSTGDVCHGEVRYDPESGARIDAPGVVLSELSPLAELCDVPGPEGHAHASSVCMV